MIKDPDAIYECKRTHSWLKAKPFIEVTLKVVSVEEGTGRNKGRLGAVLVEGEDDGHEYSLSVEADLVISNVKNIGQNGINLLVNL